MPDDRLFCKVRSRQRGAGQYQKQDSRGEFFQVREGAAALLINLSDYLDSGLFLDHRLTRERVFREAGGKRVLNLFCYTGASACRPRSAAPARWSTSTCRPITWTGRGKTSS